MIFPEKGKIIYAAEEWPFPVSPELTVLTKKPDLAETFRNNYPGVLFDSFVMADGNLIIQDCTPNLKADQNSEFNSRLNDILNNPESKATFQIADAREMTETLVELLRRKELVNTLIFYPGNGALAVKNYLNMIAPDFAQGIFIPTRRKMIGKGKFDVSVDIPDNLLCGFSRVLIIDDVLASGQTAKTLAWQLGRKMGILPTIDFACWLMLPNQDARYKCGLPYYSSVTAALVVKGNNVRRPAINSLSCFLDQSGRYDVVKEDYQNKYLNGGTEIELIKKLIRRFL